jgi:hypothetical protein
MSARFLSCAVHPEIAYLYLGAFLAASYYVATVHTMRLSREAAW